MTPGASEAALEALSVRLGLPLAFDDDACSVMVGEQPFSIRRDGPGDRLVVSAIVADDLPDAPSRKLVEDLLNLGFGLMHDGLPAVARDPETGFLAAFAIFADRLPRGLRDLRGRPAGRPRVPGRLREVRRLRAALDRPPRR